MEQFGMGAGPDKVDRTGRPGRIIELVNQQEVATHMAFPVVRPCAFEGVIPPFGTEGSVVFDKKQHDGLQPLHIVSAGARKPFPVL